MTSWFQNYPYMLHLVKNLLSYWRLKRRPSLLAMAVCHLQYWCGLWHKLSTFFCKIFSSVNRTKIVKKQTRWLKGQKSYCQAQSQNQESQVFESLIWTLVDNKIKGGNNQLKQSKFKVLSLSIFGSTTSNKFSPPPHEKVPFEPIKVG